MIIHIQSLASSYILQIHSFTQGEAVKILEDVNNVRDLQEGHGGWNDEMQAVGFNNIFLVQA